MTVSDNLYISERIRHPERVLKKLYNRKFMRKCVLVIYSKDDDRIEMISSYFLKQKHYQNREFIVAGVFLSEDDAMEYIRLLVAVSYKKFSDFVPLDAVKSIRVIEIEEYIKEEKVE